MKQILYNILYKKHDNTLFSELLDDIKLIHGSAKTPEGRPIDEGFSNVAIKNQAIGYWSAARKDIKLVKSKIQ